MGKRRMWVWIILSILLVLFFVLGYLFSSAPNKLIITRDEDNVHHLPAIEQTITDKQLVTKLYYEIFLLPQFPKGTIHCPVGGLAKYNLTFYQDEIIMLQTVLNTSGCQRLTSLNGDIKWALDRKFINYSTEIQNALKLSNTDFYGSR